VSGTAKAPQTMKTLRMNIAAVALAALPLFSRAFPAQRTVPALEYEVKAAFLLNFTRFIDWPPGAPQGAPFNLCILGDDPFDGVLDRIMAGESVNGRKLVVRRLGNEPTGECQLVFTEANPKQVSSMISRLGPGVLTVGEGDAFLKEGGMIAFVLENRHVRFDINHGAASKAALRISSRLLSVARSVEE
jgi:YfiR/HmsC-like